MSTYDVKRYRRDYAIYGVLAVIAIGVLAYLVAPLLAPSDAPAVTEQPAVSAPANEATPAE